MAKIFEYNGNLPLDSAIVETVNIDTRGDENIFINDLIVSKDNALAKITGFSGEKSEARVEVINRFDGGSGGGSRVDSVAHTFSNRNLTTSVHQTDGTTVTSNTVNIPDTTGITSVVHDDTLTGNGTSASPLAVVGSARPQVVLINTDLRSTMISDTKFLDAIDVQIYASYIKIGDFMFDEYGCISVVFEVTTSSIIVRVMTHGNG